jgi:hypothetical protein
MTLTIVTPPWRPFIGKIHSSGKSTHRENPLIGKIHSSGKSTHRENPQEFSGREKLAHREAAMMAKIDFTEIPQFSQLPVRRGRQPLDSIVFRPRLTVRNCQPSNRQHYPFTARYRT